MQVLLVFSALLALAVAKTEYPLDETAFPASLKDSKALKNFVKLVEENNLNVTVILSETDYYSNHKVKDAVAMAFTFPVNNVQLKKSEFTKEQGKKFLKTATDEKLAAKIIHVAEETAEYTNMDHGVPETFSHQILSVKGKGGSEFPWDDVNYAAQFMFISVGPDGKNETTRVLMANLETTVVQSENLNDEELKTIRKALADTLMLYEDSEIPEVLTKVLSSKITPKADWNVASEVGEHNYVDSKKWALIEAVGDKYLIYAL